MAVYTDLITSEHNKRPNFVAVVQALTQPLADCTQALEALPVAFSLDNAVGVQLDAVGRWVGLSRVITVPLDQPFFSWDTPGKGWNQAPWKRPYTSDVGMSSLDDDAYRTALKAKVAKNYWQGTNEELEAILADALLDLGVILVPVDHMDMTVTIHIQGELSPQMLQMVERGFITPKAMGVRINNVDDGGGGALWFALDSNNAGLDAGKFR